MTLLPSETSFPPETRAVGEMPRAFTAAEEHLRQRAQRELIQRRLNAQVTAPPATSSADRFLAIVPRQTSTPPEPPVTTPVIPPSIEAALEQVRRPQPGSPAAWAEEATERVRPLIETHVRRRDARHNLLTVYRALAQAAYTLIQMRGQSVHTTTSTFFTVVDLLPVVTGLSSDQCERSTRRLQDLGLIHKSSGAVPTRRHGVRSYEGGTWVPTTFKDAATGERVTRRVCAGTWVAVLLRPGPGRVARVICHELPPCPRDLTGDRRSGRTAWQMRQEAKSEVRESIPRPGGQWDISPLIQWSVQTQPRTSLGKKESRTSGSSPWAWVWGLDEVARVHPRQRQAAVRDGAARLVQALDDAGREMHYHRMLWRAIWAEYRGVRAFGPLIAAVQRTLIAKAETGLRSPGAWLMRLLRECGWVDAVYNVGAVPGDADQVGM